MLAFCKASVRCKFCLPFVHIGMPEQNFQQYVFLANSSVDKQIEQCLCFSTFLLYFADRSFVPSGMLCLSLIIRRWS